MHVVVIPAYQPDEMLITLTEELLSHNLSVLVVDDGSSTEHQWVFHSLPEQVAVLHLPHQGKGAALRLGFANLLQQFPDCTHFITADADGQHKVEDILRVSNLLQEEKTFVLTMRKPKKEVPARSKFGNALSRVVYTIMNGHYFDDNQSGLRGFSVEHIPWLLQVKGDKYDYEMNMLCHADKQNIKITPLPIETIYLDGNKSSHFNPIMDTIRIYKRLFTSVWPSLAGVAIWEVLTLITTMFLNYEYQFVTIPSAVMISALLTHLLQKYIVYRKLPYRDGWRMLLFALIRSAAYFCIVQTILLATEMIPLAITVNFAAIVMLIAEYYIHKRMHRIFRKQ
ncbi:MAG: glycosyltransferase family 2 protein [Clostridia bacterium]|nr:glycosyltransferase family 2 protein [Clostridia bacterium]